MSDNWIVQNLNSALNTWNEKLEEIWTLLTQSPESFKGGTIWSVITGINGALTAIGYGLLVLFFAAGIVKTCGSFTDMKKPEHALKAFIRFALAQGAIMYGMELMTALFSIVQGIVSTIMAQSGMTNGGVTELPAEIVEKIESVGMLESIPLWIVTLLGSLLVDQHIIIWHFRRIKLCRNNAGIFHPRTPGILVITVIEKIITVITRLKMGYFNFPDSANYGIK